MKKPRVEHLEEFMRIAFDVLEHSDTWDVIQKPREAKLLHSKWEFKLKMHSDGTIERYKARLVVRGYEQVYRVDYTYTCSAVEDMISGKVILEISLIWGVPARPVMRRALTLKQKKKTIWRYYSTYLREWWSIRKNSAFKTRDNTR